MLLELKFTLIFDGLTQIKSTTGQARLDSCKLLKAWRTAEGVAQCPHRQSKAIITSTGTT